MPSLSAMSLLAACHAFVVVRTHGNLTEEAVEKINGNAKLDGHTARTPSEEYKQEWKKTKADPIISEFDSFDELKTTPKCNTLVGEKGVCGEKSIHPKSKPVRISAVLRLVFNKNDRNSRYTYLYHGGNIQPQLYSEGMDSIDYGKANDLIAGPAWFTTPNVLLAAKNAEKSIEALPINKTCEGQTSQMGYRTVVQLKVTKPKTCVGLVPDSETMRGFARLDVISNESRYMKAEYLDQICRSHKSRTAGCSFVAINWNFDGKPEQGPPPLVDPSTEIALPYEFRLFPRAKEECGITFHRILLIASCGKNEPYFNQRQNSPLRDARDRGMRSDFGDLWSDARMWLREFVCENREANDAGDTDWGC